MPKKSFRVRYAALRISLIYLGVSTLWIIFSDRLVNLLVTEPGSNLYIQIFKGLFFVLVTSYLIYYLINGHTEETIKESERRVTAVREADEKLRESSNFFEQLYLQSNMSTQLLDPEGWCVTINPKLSEIFGVRPEDIEGKKYNIFKDDEIVRTGVAEKLKKVFEKKQTVSWEVNFDIGHASESTGVQVTKAEKRWFYNVAYPIVDTHGQLINVVIQHEDITERKLAEIALRDSEEKFRSIFENHSAAKLIIDPDSSKIQDANNAAAEMYGWSVNELRSMKISDININSEEKVRADIESVIGGRNYNYEFQHRRSDGELMNVEVFTSAVEIEGRKYLHSIIHDITEKKTLERQLLQSQKMESVGKLAGGVAHDFNNILQVILTMSEVLERKIDNNNEGQKYLQEIARSARRAADLTRQLLAFARKQNIEPKVLYINEIVGDMLKMLKRLIGEDIDLRWIADRKNKLIRMDPSQIDQILANLCVNARDAIGGVGEITIETSYKVIDEVYCRMHAGFIPGNFVLLSVSDTGEGMNKETLDKIFDPFYTTKSVGEGTGLGLSTVYGIVKQNEGFINVYSEVGQGTIFNIYIPAYEGEVPRQRAAEDQTVAAGNGERILLCEDDEAIISIIGDMLKDAGYEVVTADDPFEAIRLFETDGRSFDLLISDVVMPKMTGKALAEYLLEKDDNLKILYMSGYTANVIANRGVLKEGANFIQKPFTRNELARKVYTVLSSADRT